MDQQRWQHDFRRALSSEGLPPAYVERLLAELLDHWSEILSEDSSMIVSLDRLGNPTALAQATALEYRRRTFAGRHPRWVFLAGPLVLAVASFTACVAMAILAAMVAKWAAVDVFGLTKEQTSALQFQLFQGAGWILGFLPFSVAAICLCKLADRACVPWMWLLPGGALLTFLAISFFATATMNTDPPSGTFGAGFSHELTGLKLLQAIPPILIFGYSIGRIRRRFNDGPSPA